MARSKWFFFNKHNAQGIRDDILTAVAAVEKKHGIDIAIDHSVIKKDRLEIGLACRMPNIQSPQSEASIFQSRCCTVNVMLEAFGQSFDVDGKAFTICGIDTDNPSKPIVASHKTRRRNFPVSVVPSRYMAPWAKGPHRQVGPNRPDLT